MKCTNCGGTLYFDIQRKKLVCAHCGSTFRPQDYKKDNSPETALTSESSVYVCRSCGAALISGNDEAVVYCSYCGNQADLSGEVRPEDVPKYILPFSVTREQCREKYTAALKKNLYIPKEFKDPSFIDRFRPIYIPYWMYYVRFTGEPVNLKGTRTYTSNGYDYHDEYEVSASIHDQGLYGVPYDASRNFDDTIAEEIAPFHRKGLTVFYPGYLAGMYADRPNVPADVYEEDVLEKATDSALADIQKDFPGIKLELPGSSSEKQKLLQSRYTGYDAVYLPVWFLTWKKGNRVAYAVVNGQTGKVHIDAPVDIGRFLLFTLGGAAILFLLLSLLMTVTAQYVMLFSGILLLLSASRYRKELQDIRNRENHVFDRGYLIRDEEELAMPAREREKLRKKAKKSFDFTGILGAVIMVLLFVGFPFAFAVIGALFDMLVSDSGQVFLNTCLLILSLVIFARSVSAVRYMRSKSSYLPCLAALAGHAFSAAAAWTQPVQDWWYYLGALISLLASALICADLIRKFNLASTRALPSFYSREGGAEHV